MELHKSSKKGGRTDGVLDKVRNVSNNNGVLHDPNDVKASRCHMYLCVSFANVLSSIIAVASLLYIFTRHSIAKQASTFCVCNMLRTL